MDEIVSSSEVGESSSTAAARAQLISAGTQTGASGNTQTLTSASARNRGLILARTQSGSVVGNTQNNPAYFPFKELQDATNNFHRELRIKKGSNADIFRATLKPGQIVAVKRLKHHHYAERDKRYAKDIGIYYRVRHPNVIKLVGSCLHEDERILVYEFMPLGNLHDHLIDRRSGHPTLDWHTRMNIASGVAKGLSYLQNEAKPHVSHRNLNTTNVLLSDNFQPKVSGIRIEPYGTVSGLYQFGILLLEIITGEEAKDWTRGYAESIVPWVKHILAFEKEVTVADRKMRCRFPRHKLRKALELVLYCLKFSGSVSGPFDRVERAMEYLTMPNPSMPWPLHPIGFEIDTRPPESLIFVDYLIPVNVYDPMLLSLNEIRRAIVNDLPTRIHGHRGVVFKGKLQSGKVVAMKWLRPRNMDKVYKTDVKMLSRLSHANIIKLVGHCAEGAERVVVYEFMDKGSLYDLLHARKVGQEALNWGRRMKIACDVAKALSYLHYEANPPVIYGDLKSSNILIDYKFNAKISGFGTAQSALLDVTTSGVMDTLPYWAPERALFGRLTLKSDVFNFGVILLEIIAGHVTLNKDYGSYISNQVMRENDFLNLVDPMLKVPSVCANAHPVLFPRMSREMARYKEYVNLNLRGKTTVDNLMKAMKVASMCVSACPDSRPDMATVVRAMAYLTYDPSVTVWPQEFTLEGREQ